MLAASGRGHIRLVAALLDAGTNVDMMNPNGETPLLAAADHGQLEVLVLTDPPLLSRQAIYRINLYQCRYQYTLYSQVATHYCIR